VLFRSGKVSIVIYNSLAQERQEFVSIPINTQAAATGVSILDGSGSPVTSQIIQNSAATIALGHLEGSVGTTGEYNVLFRANLPAVGHVTFTLDFDGRTSQKSQRVAMNSRSQFSLDNGILQLSFLARTGRLNSIKNLLDNVTVNLEQNFLQYYSSVGNNVSDQRSGAYIFRPIQNSAEEAGARTTNISEVISGPLMQELRQDFGSNITQVFRLYADANFVEIEWTVGPLGCGDGFGKEVISRFTTDIESGVGFFTDSNGREMQNRTRDYRETWNLQNTEPVSQNYYPVNTAIYIQDESSRLTILTDRSQGGSSLDNGQLELMVHRKTMKDDSRGVNEPIADPGVDGQGLIVRGKQYLIVDTPTASPALHKSLNQRMTYPPILFFGQSQGSFQKSRPVSRVEAPLNPAVHLLTKQVWSADRTQYLIRLNHVFEEGEGVGNVAVSLADVFPGQTIKAVAETKLTANQPFTHPTGPARRETDWEITLSPMEIRTFVVTVA